MFGDTNHWQLDCNKHTPNPTRPPAVQPTVVFGHRSPARGKSWARHVHPLPLYGNNGAALHPALVCSAFRFGTATRLLVHFRFRPMVNAPSPLFISISEDNADVEFFLEQWSLNSPVCLICNWEETRSRLAPWV